MAALPIIAGVGWAIAPRCPACGKGRGTVWRWVVLLAVTCIQPSCHSCIFIAPKWSICRHWGHDRGGVGAGRQRRGQGLVALEQRISQFCTCFSLPLQFNISSLCSSCPLWISLDLDSYHSLLPLPHAPWSAPTLAYLHYILLRPLWSASNFLWLAISLGQVLEKSTLESLGNSCRPHFSAALT